jgi:hypothetical protein
MHKVTLMYVAVRHDGSLDDEWIRERVHDAMQATKLEFATALVPPEKKKPVRPKKSRRRAARRAA